MDLQDVMKGTVARIVAQLADMDDATLAEAHAIEAALDEPKRRTTLLAAIEGEQDARTAQAALEAKAAELVALAAGEGVTLHTDAAMSAVLARVEALENRLGLAEARHPEVRIGAVRAIEPLDLTVALTGPVVATTIAFTDAQDATLPMAPDLRFGAADFHIRERIMSPTVKQVTARLEKEILIAGGGARGEVCKLWLLDDEGRGVAAIELMAPLPVGGGTTGRFAPRSLVFVFDMPA